MRQMSQPQNDPDHDLVGEERTEGTVRNQQVGRPTGRGHSRWQSRWKRNMDMGRWVGYQGKRAREEGMCVCGGGVDGQVERPPAVGLGVWDTQAGTL